MSKSFFYCIILMFASTFFINKLNAQSIKCFDDSIKKATTIKQDYYFKSGKSRAIYVHIKERIEILNYLINLKWTENEKLEIFNLYINTQYHSEPHEVKLNQAFKEGKLSNVLEQNRKELQKRLIEIAGLEGKKNFWKNIELITSKYTDHSMF